MRMLFEQFGQALGESWRRYICDEDPDERRKRLHKQALKEIDAKLLSIIKSQITMQEWTSDLQRQDRELEAA